MAVILLGALLRLLWLGKYPSGFFRDEAALGYNVFSVLKTGMDEYGMRLPIVFRSFEVFFLPAYIYLSAPIVGILGLSEFSTRLLSSLSGIGGLFVAYFIAKEIWNEKVALWATLILAISPWHIFYSRGAFEGNLALTFFATGFLFWIKFIKHWEGRHFFLSTLFFALSMYSYQAERMVVPLFAMIAVSLSRTQLWEIRKKLVFPIIAITIFCLPLLSLTLKPGGYHRAAGVSVFSQSSKPSGWIENKEKGIFINNNFYLRSRQVLSLYSSYFSPRNLFVKGDANRQRSVDNFSVFYPWFFLFLIYGVWCTWKKRDLNKKLLFAWIFLAPLPAALTGDPFHTYRSLLLYLPLTLFMGLGVSKISGTLKNSKNPKGVKLYHPAGVMIIAVSVISLSQFLFNYLVLNSATRARDWDYGYKQIVEFIGEQENYKKVVVDDMWTEGYIQFLFFNKTRPEIYHEQVAKIANVSYFYYNSGEEIRPNSYEDFEFRRVDWPSERGDSGVVFVMGVDRLPDSEFVNDPKVELLTKIYYPDGTIAYKIVKIR
ncbi:glycosyltransferase family 39 protein [Patescibacteria group bacterium]|nr:glycosyltransferase family 39 protein [Patescibacteria group bacterium]